MTSKLEELAKWHEGLAVKARRQFMRAGAVEIVDIDKGIDAAQWHTDMAQTVREAMGEIERLRKAAGQNHDLHNAAINKVVDLQAALKDLASRANSHVARALTEGA
jgi:hypothetical protein